MTAVVRLSIYKSGLNLLLGWGNEMIQGGHFEPDEDWDWVLVEEDDEN